MRYENFDLEIAQRAESNGAERISVRVLDSPVDRQTSSQAEVVSLKPDLYQRAGLLARRRLDQTELLQLGDELGDALLPPTVRTMFERSRERLPEDCGLRIRLALESYKLADLPWEYAHVADPNKPPTHGFLVFDRHISLVRYEVLARAPGVLDPVQGNALRMVVILSSPQGAAPLDLQREQQNIKGALQGLPAITPEFYPQATIETLLDALMRGAHIFHYSGHGLFKGDLSSAYGTQDGQGHLLLNNADAQGVEFAADKLALNLSGRNVRLAVLNACESSKSDQINAWTGIASAITRAGIPAVVGMQFTIRDENAISFSRFFYRALAAGQSIDEAVTEGRRAIFSSATDDAAERDWGVPVLYLRAEDGVLFPKAAESTTPSTRTTNAAPAPADSSTDKRALRTALVQAFSLEELESLCFDIQQELTDSGQAVEVSLEMIGGASKTAKVINLIAYLDRRALLHYLVKAVRTARPGVI
jgi:catechol 2,3-dioxygenase-like lactoylglutathione lyase family enzyme